MCGGGGGTHLHCKAAGRLVLVFALFHIFLHVSWTCMCVLFVSCATIVLARVTAALRWVGVVAVEVH